MKVKVENEYNKVTVKRLPKPYKIVYTYIKNHDGISCKELFKKFKNFDIEDIVLDLKDMLLIYLTDENDKVI